MGKALSGELSCPCDRSCSDSENTRVQHIKAMIGLILCLLLLEVHIVRNKMKNDWALQSCQQYCNYFKAISQFQANEEIS